MIDMENQKPSGRRPARRFEKPQVNEVKSRRPVGKPVVRSVKKVSNVKHKAVTQIRLNRFIANSGVCSRRDADEHIKNGLISVNGRLVKDLGTKVTYDDDVRFKNKRLSAEKKVYILMNKPKDYVTTVEDPHAEHTVLELIGDGCSERVYPVGRLDKATTGVLLLTNDGDLAGKLTHPKYKRKKIYHVFLDKPVTKNHLFELTEGIELDGVKVVADAVSYADQEDKSQIGIELHSGQNRVIRRMFETLGYKVKKLDRVYFAGLTKKNVQRGKWRFLTDKEVIMLKRGIF
jgi:23S rRNA pseudouridine2605 synthase